MSDITKEQREDLLKEIQKVLRANMSDITKEQREDLLKEIQKVLPDAIYSKQSYMSDSISFSNECGCYSEYTTESCNFKVAVAGTLPESEADQVKLDNKIESIVDSWANDNLSWSGCHCCGNVLSVWTILYKIEQEESNA